MKHAACNVQHAACSMQRATEVHRTMSDMHPTARAARPNVLRATRDVQRCQRARANPSKAMPSGPERCDVRRLLVWPRGCGQPTPAAGDRRGAVHVRQGSRRPLRTGCASLPPAPMRVISAPQNPSRLSAVLARVAAVADHSCLRMRRGRCSLIDRPPHPRVLQIVFSTTANAKLLSLNPAAALAARGVAGFFSAADIPGKNSVRPSADVAAAGRVGVRKGAGSGRCASDRRMAAGKHGRQRHAASKWEKPESRHSGLISFASA